MSHLNLCFVRFLKQNNLEIETFLSLPDLFKVLQDDEKF